jgi:hypothetical protein
MGLVKMENTETNNGSRLLSGPIGPICTVTLLDDYRIEIAD